MKSVIVVLVLVAAVSAVPNRGQKIVGGSLATISQYPYGVALLYSYNLVTYSQACGGTIITTKAVLSAAHCVYLDSPTRWRLRVGSSYANSGGSVHQAASITVHSGYNGATSNNDVAILKSATAFTYGTSVRAGSIAGSSYILNDNQAVWAIGWGTTSSGGTASEQLRHVQIWTVNQSECNRRYNQIGWSVTNNMLCSGWLDVGGRDQCQGDSGGPLIHNGVVVGICSWGYSCALPQFPGVNTRVSQFTTWIQANA